MHAICVTVEGESVNEVTQGNQGFIKRSNTVEFIQYDKITVSSMTLTMVQHGLWTRQLSPLAVP